MSEHWMTRLMGRIKNIVGVGAVTGSEVQWIQIKAATGRTNDRIRRVHNYGFMSRPLVGAKAYNLFLGGVTARGIAINVEDERYQIELQPGEVAVLDDKGNLIHLTETGVTIKSVDKIDITAKGDITANTEGNIIHNGKTIQLNGGKGVITCASICPFTGSAHVDGSTTVMAGKN